MGLLDTLYHTETWDAFAAYKQEKGHLSKRDLVFLTDFITTKAYLPVVQRIQNGQGFDYPHKLLINKMGKAKKRVVYSFSNTENWTLKLIAWLLYSYDDNQPQGCYSFRRNMGVHKAIHDLIKTPDIASMWCYKLDISNYFNSIKVPLLMPILDEVFSGDPALLTFFEQLLTADKAYINGQLTSEQRGAMAGTATSPFFANLYLRQLDAFFVERSVAYARYSDDVILFAKTEQELISYHTSALDILNNHGLTVNHDKECTVAPGGKWDFLGIAYCNGTIDLSDATKDKIKGKIRRKGRALRRWMLRKDADPQRAIKAFIRSFNRKFFVSSNPHNLTWARWFFPLLTTADGLKEVDVYLQQYARYIPTGKHNHANYRINYQDLKRLGYRSLVHEYYKQKEGYSDR
jgi:hypothetical protein